MSTQPAAGAPAADRKSSSPASGGTTGPGAGAKPVERIEVRLRVGRELMAASDDPLFLRLGGGGGREFRLAFARGRGLRRGREETYVLGSPSASGTNVAHPELNDPTPLDAAAIASASLVKGQSPIPNVRGVGELDDRLKLEDVEVTIHTPGVAPLRFQRGGEHWLGLVCGLTLELARVDESS